MSAIRLAFDDVGSGTPLVLLHGFPHNRHLWDAQRSELRHVCRVITPDLRGFGDSPATSPNSMDEYADDVVTLLDALGVGRAIVGGLSMGGYVSLALWRRHRTRVLALVLADTRASADSAQMREKRMSLIQLARDEGALAVADAQAMSSLGATTRRTHPALVHRIRDMMATTPVDSIVGALQAMMARADSTDMLRTIDVPTLVMVGDEDVLTPAREMRAMNDAIAQSEICVLDNAGHLSCVEQPATFNAALLNFAQRVSHG